MKIREMVYSDVNEVYEIEKSVSAEPWSLELFASEFEIDPDKRYWVVIEHVANENIAFSSEELSGEILGFAGVMTVGDEAQILNLAVKECRQKVGCGAKLVSTLLDEAKIRGSKTVYLEVREDNEPAKSLYNKFGFKAVSKRMNYYGPGINSITMYKPIGSM